MASIGLVRVAGYGGYGVALIWSGLVGCMNDGCGGG